MPLIGSKYSKQDSKPVAIPVGKRRLSDGERFLEIMSMERVRAYMRELMHLPDDPDYDEDDTNPLFSRSEVAAMVAEQVADGRRRKQSSPAEPAEPPPAAKRAPKGGTKGFGGREPPQEPPEAPEAPTEPDDD